MANKQPVTPLSAHPLFPAVVAVWFAALFGLGCAVLPATVIEGVVTATGLPKLVAAAAPPLGFTAQAIVAVAAALFGGLCGFMLAGKLTAAQGAVRPPHGSPRKFAAPGEKSGRKKDKEGARRPLSIKDDLDDEPLFASGFVAEEPLAGRRRSFLPMADQQAQETPAAEPEVADAFEPEFSTEPLFADEPEYDAPVSFDGPAAYDEALPEDIHYPEPETLADFPDETPAPEPAPVIEPEASLPALAQGAPTGILPSDPRADLGRMGIVQLTERLGHALQGRLDQGQSRPLAPPPALLAELAELAGVAPRPVTAEPEPVPAAPPQDAFHPAPEAEPAPAPEQEFAVADFTPSPFAVPDFPLDEIDPQEAIFGAADIEPAPQRSATFAPSMTEALRSAALQLDEFGEDEEEDESEFAEEQYGSLLAIRGLTGDTRDHFSEPDEDADYENEGETPHDSADSRPFDARPAEAQGADHSETEDETEALRRALAQLQRISGAA